MGGCKELVVLLLVGSVAVVISTEKIEIPRPRLPIITSVTAETSEWNAGASITVEYLAPEKPMALWFVDGLPIPEARRVDYTVYNIYREKGSTSLTASRNKWSQFGLCLLNTAGENCIFLNTLPDQGSLNQEVDFPWPLMTPGPLVRYKEDQLLKIHAPKMDVPYNYTYSATLISKNPFYSHGSLVKAESRGMSGGGVDDKVRFTPQAGGKGWMVSVRTDLAPYEGVLLMNTTYRPRSGLVQYSTLLRPFSIYIRGHSGPFPSGFVASVPDLTDFRCREHMACMVICPFLSNGPVNVTISRRQITAVLNAEDVEFPMLPEEEVATTRMLGPYMGYGYIFIPNFIPRRDTGTYECEYDSRITRAFGAVDVM